MLEWTKPRSNKESPFEIGDIVEFKSFNSDMKKEIIGITETHYKIKYLDNNALILSRDKEFVESELKVIGKNNHSKIKNRLGIK